MDETITTYRGPRPPTNTSEGWGRRTQQLIRDPSMQRVAHGLWCRADAPPDSLQRAVLLQCHLNHPGRLVRLTGPTALQVMGVPIGWNYPWADRALRHPAPSRAGDLDRQLRDVTHLSWLGERCQTRDPDLALSKSYGMESFAGPWGATLVHPVEALVVAAPFMSRGALTAALDALLVDPHVQPVEPSTTPQGQPFLTASRIHAALEALPPTSRAVVAVRKAMRATLFPTFSPMETLTRLMVVAAGLPSPVMNYRVHTPRGDSLLDLAWPATMTAVEFNGRVHSQNHQAYKDEMYRNEVLRDLGWNLRILVFDDLRDPRRAAAWLSWLGRQLGTTPRPVTPFRP